MTDTLPTEVAALAPGSKVLLLDGNSLAYRAFFALPPDLTTASGQHTNAVLGFTSMLVNLVKDQKPDMVVATFDRPEPTFRHLRNPEYKAQRDKTPDILIQQMGLIRQLVDTLKIPTVYATGFEADDVIGTLALQARELGLNAVIVTGDRDSYQLVNDPHIKVMYNRRGVSDYVLYDEAGIFEKTGVRPAQYPEYAALRGDTSDNLPGIAGVGEKTAAKLITTYGGLDGIFANTASQTPKLRESLTNGEALARANVEMMRIVTDCPVDQNLVDLRPGTFDVDEVKRFFDLLEFRTLWDRFTEAFGVNKNDAGGATAAATGVLEAEVRVVDSAFELAALLQSLDHVALAHGDNGLAIVVDAATGDVAWAHGPAIDGLVIDKPAWAHDAKSAMRLLFAHGGDITNLVIDTAIAAYLIDPAGDRYALGEILTKYTGATLPAVGSPSGQLDFGETVVDPAVDAARRALAVARLAPVLLERLAADGVESLNRDMEAPLVRVLARMEAAGVGVDAVVLRVIRDHLVAECDRLTKETYSIVGREFNVNSTLQLREILFNELKLVPGKKGKTGYSTDAATLEKLRDQHPMVELLLQYREVEKLRSTYGEGLLNEVQSDGRIHATFNQTVARTGRLSSDAPNLHNIPVRSETGRLFRTAFVPAAGCELLVADYNQVELRCIAHLANDPGLIEAFTSGRDVHTETASRVFGVDAADVTHEMRAKAKMVSYGLAYGMEAYGLGQRLGIPTGEAAVILNAYFDAFPNVKSYMERTVVEALNRGYTETLFGRRRPIPELMSDNFRVRQAAERQAMNAGIQGLAADIFKVALVRLDHELTARKMASRLVLQVHDEVILEVPPHEHDAAVALVRDTMMGAADLTVPLDVNLAFGPTWADAKA